MCVFWKEKGEIVVDKNDRLLTFHNGLLTYMQYTATISAYVLYNGTCKIIVFIYISVKCLIASQVHHFDFRRFDVIYSRFFHVLCQLWNWIITIISLNVAIIFQLLWKGVQRMDENIINFFFIKCEYFPILFKINTSSKFKRKIHSKLKSFFITIFFFK